MSSVTRSVRAVGSGRATASPPGLMGELVARLRRAAALPRRCRSESGSPTPVRPVKGQGGRSVGREPERSGGSEPGLPCLAEPLTEPNRCGTQRPTGRSPRGAKPIDDEAIPRAG